MNRRLLTGWFYRRPAQAAIAFRAILDAMSRPGTHPDGGGRGAARADVGGGRGDGAGAARSTTPLHLAGAHDCPALRDWLTFHTGAPLVGAAEAVFALGAWDALQPVSRFAIGTAEYPDRAATLIVEMPGLAPEGAMLRGPGINGTARLSLPEVAAFRANRALFPLGFDAIFTCGDRLAGLPRSTLVEAF